MRKFGIEIEFGGSMARAAEALVTAGLAESSTRHGYIGHDDRYWCIKSDGSVASGGELVSPPLDFDDPAQREQVTRAIEALRSVGCTTDVSAGIHVHVESLGMNHKQLITLVKLWTKFEDVIYRVASSGWMELRSGARSYAKPLPDPMVKGLLQAKTDNQFSSAWYSCGQQLNYDYQNSTAHGDSSRYYALNLHSHFYRGTVEFRAFNSSMNPERIQGYIAMCVALVTEAKKAKARSISSTYKLGGMHAGTTKPENAFHRFQQILRYEAGMDLDDMKRLTRIWKDSVPQQNVFSNAW